ncbi:MAG: hypothetical protein ACI9VR_000934 [Cognaticolwellia sp.]|jgi:hypothetical protein
MVIQALGENDAGTTPTQEELVEWADQYGQTIPVVADAGWELENRFSVDTGIPSFTLIAPGGEVIAADDWGSEGLIDSVLPENYEFIERPE